MLACVQTITKLWLVNQSLISSARRLTQRIIFYKWQSDKTKKFVESGLHSKPWLRPRL